MTERKQQETVTGLKYTYGTLPRCPSCRGVDLRRYKTLDRYGEESTSYAYCRTCGTKCLIVMRPAEV